MQRSYPKRNPVSGWRVTLALSGYGDWALDVLVGVEFPFSAPQIALVDRTRFLVWPHVESDGILCLLSEEDIVDHRRPAGVLEHLLTHAAQLIADCVSGRNRSDLLTECNAYWDQSASAETAPVRSLVSLRPPSRLITWWAHGKVVVAAESVADMAHWVANYLGTDKANPDQFSQGLFLWLPEPMFPWEFPKTATDLRELVRAQAGSALDLLDSLVKPNLRRIRVLTTAPVEGGAFAGAVIVQRSVPSGHGRARGRAPRGFREGHVPHRLVITQFFGSQRAQRVSVLRSEGDWVHGRLSDTKFARLQAARVVILGCGSLGANIALMLAQAGVGTFLLVDPQVLAPANTSRHPLGAHEVGQFKATALAAKLRRDYPHILSVIGKASGWQRLDESARAQLQTSSLVVCSIGNTARELSINHWVREYLPELPVLYGWLEPHACAAHGVVVRGTGGCFECGFDASNQPRFVATDWPQGVTTHREPGCAATFQSYGSVELLSGASTIAELALDCLAGSILSSTERIRVCSTRRLHALGGRWSPHWEGLVGREGDTTIERIWNSSPDCMQCQLRGTRP